MTSRVLHSHAVEELVPSTVADSFANPVWNPVRARVPRFAAPAGEFSDLAIHDGNCLKGLAWALAIEAAAVLLCVGAWQLWNAYR